MAPQVRNNPQQQKAIEIFNRFGGILRTKEAMGHGIHPGTLYALRDAGIIESLSRGVYRLKDAPHPSEPDLIIISHRIPQGVICLLSALSMHHLTTQVPHVIHIALPYGAREPRLDYPPLHTYRFRGASYTEGVDQVLVDEKPVKVYNPEKTLADCFKFRNRIGMDSITEALRLYRSSGKMRIDALMRYAAICRVTNIIRPYLETILG